MQLCCVEDRQKAPIRALLVLGNEEKESQSTVCLPWERDKKYVHFFGVQVSLTASYLVLF